MNPTPPPTENIGTPRVDKVEFYWPQVPSYYIGKLVTVDFARTLERELILLQRISDAQDEALQKQIKQIIELENIIAKLQSFLTTRAAMADKSSKDWASANGDQSPQASYRSGMCYAFEQVKGFMERKGNL